jgi:nucleotidyltransferase/DNA polymerase involved in DNA repair
MFCALFEPFILWQAAYEQPTLRDKPLISLEKSKVAHASSLARRAGIEAGMTVDGARARCNELVIVERDPVSLQNAWHDVLEQLYAFTSFIESPKPGVVFLELAPSDATQLAESFQARLAFGKTQEAARLQALMTRTGAASLLEKPLSKFPLRILSALGVMAKTLERLAWLGLKTLGDLSKWTKHNLIDYLGDEAAPIIRYLHGPFTKTVNKYTPPVVLRATHSFDEIVSEPFQLEPVLQLLARRLETGLETKVASRLTVRAIAQGIAFSATKISRNPLKQSSIINLLAQSALGETGAQPLGIERLELSLSGLYKFSEQGMLWGKANAQHAIEKVNERYPGALLKIEHVDTFLPDSEFSYRLVPIQGSLQTVQKSKSKAPTQAKEGVFAF